METRCEECMHFIYDDEMECYDCEMQLDEDEVCRFLSSGQHQCPFYRFGDEYQIVKKQM